MDEEEKHEIDKVSIKHPLGQFTYRSWGSLELSGHNYDRRVAEYMPLLEPLKTKRGAIAKRQPKKPRGQPALWWKAQCAFRGLQSKGPLEEYQNALRGHENDPICDEVIKVEKAAKEKFKIENEKEKENRWLNKWSDEEKSYKNPRRYLNEKFKPGGSSKEIVQLQTHRLPMSGTTWICQIAEELGLECRTTDDPKNLDSMWRHSYSLAIIGQNKAAVDERVKFIKEDVKQAEIAIEKEKARLRKKAQEAERQREEEARKEARKREIALENCKDWDVTGTWEISCPYIEENWGDYASDKLTMKIYRQDTSKGPQMFATFEFMIMDGVMRFERPILEKPRTVSKAGSNSKLLSHGKRLREESDEEDDDERARSPTPEAFYLGATKEPSAKHREWKYRYRAMQCDSTEIQLGEDETLYGITFLGPKGRTLKGRIGASMFEECDFTGVKIEPGGKNDVDVGDAWAALNQQAYDYYSRARWH